MKKMLFFAFLIIFASCSKDFPEIVNEDMLTLKSSYVYDLPYEEDVCAQKDLAVALTLSLENTELEIISATWIIEENEYTGKGVYYIFHETGQSTISVSVFLSNETLIEKEFTVMVVEDLSLGEPVMIFITENSQNTNYDLLFLFSRERIRDAESQELFYLGSMTDWKNQEVSYDSYVIGESGEPEKVADVGKYIGFELSLLEGDYQMALAYELNSDTIWADFSGSSFVKKENSGLIHFSLYEGEIIPKGDYWENSLPGLAGDYYFRFKQDEGSFTLYFKLDLDYSDQSFVVYQLEGGAYSEPKVLSPVNNFPSWGKIKLDKSILLANSISLRYGKDKNYPNVFSNNMEKSFFYDEYFKSIRVTLVEV